MTADEVNKYINEVAFSGAEEFLEKQWKIPEKSYLSVDDGHQGGVYMGEGGRGRLSLNN